MYAFDTRIVNVFSIYNNTVLRGLTVSSPPGQPDHTPTRVGVPCVPPHSTYLPRSMNTHSLCTQNALHSPASVQITLAGSLPVTQKSTIPLGSEYRNSTDACRTVRITQYRRHRSKSRRRLELRAHIIGAYVTLVAWPFPKLPALVSPPGGYAGITWTQSRTRPGRVFFSRGLTYGDRIPSGP